MMDPAWIQQSTCMCAHLLCDVPHGLRQYQAVQHTPAAVGGLVSLPACLPAAQVSGPVSSATASKTAPKVDHTLLSTTH